MLMNPIWVWDGTSPVPYLFQNRKGINQDTLHMQCPLCAAYYIKDSFPWRLSKSRDACLWGHALYNLDTTGVEHSSIPVWTT
jgi:hypothetical protein